MSQRPLVTSDHRVGDGEAQAGAARLVGGALKAVEDNR